MADQLITLKDACCLSSRRSAAPAGKARVIALAVAQRFFGADCLVSEITPEMVEAWQDELLSLGRSPSTVNRYVAFLRSAAVRAHAHGFLAEAPAAWHRSQAFEAALAEARRQSLMRSRARRAEREARKASA